MNHDDEPNASEPHDTEILTHLITKRVGKRRTSGPVRPPGIRLIRAAARRRLWPEPRPRREDRHPYRFDGCADRPPADRPPADRPADRLRSDPANGPRYSWTPRDEPARPRATRHTAALDAPRSVAPNPRARDRVGDAQADRRRRRDR